MSPSLRPTVDGRVSTAGSSLCCFSAWSASRLQVAVTRLISCNLRRPSRMSFALISPRPRPPQAGVRCGQQLIKPRTHHDPRDASRGSRGMRRGRDSHAARRVVEGVQLAVVAEQLSEPAKSSSPGVRAARSPPAPPEASSDAGEVVGTSAAFLGGGAGHRLLELHLDSGPRAQLDY